MRNPEDPTDSVIRDLAEGIDFQAQESVTRLPPTFEELYLESLATWSPIDLNGVPEESRPVFEAIAGTFDRLEEVRQEDRSRALLDRLKHELLYRRDPTLPPGDVLPFKRRAK